MDGARSHSSSCHHQGRNAIFVRFRERYAMKAASADADLAKRVFCVLMMDQLDPNCDTTGATVAFDDFVRHFYYITRASPNDRYRFVFHATKRTPGAQENEVRFARLTREIA